MSGAATGLEVEAVTNKMALRQNDYFQRRADRRKTRTERCEIEREECERRKTL